MNYATKSIQLIKMKTQKDLFLSLDIKSEKYRGIGDLQKKKRYMGENVRILKKLNPKQI